MAPVEHEDRLFYRAVGQPRGSRRPPEIPAHDRLVQVPRGTGHNRRPGRREDLRSRREGQFSWTTSRGSSMRRWCCSSSPLMRARCVRLSPRSSRRTLLDGEVDEGGAGEGMRRRSRPGSGSPAPGRRIPGSSSDADGQRGRRRRRWRCRAVSRHGTAVGEIRSRIQRQIAVPHQFRPQRQPESRQRLAEAPEAGRARPTIQRAGQPTSRCPSVCRDAPRGGLRGSCPPPPSRNR